MKSYLNRNVLIIASLAILSSCSPKIAGTWNIGKYEVSEPGKSNISVANIGTITFDKDNSGVKNIKYSIFQNEYEDKSPFKWQKINDHTISIEGEASDFSKSWLIISNGRKEQVWKSTDGSQKIQTLTLTK